MDIMSDLEDKVFDVAIVGSGLSALGASFACEKKTLDYCVVGRNNSNVYEYPNGQLITTDLKGGASNYWHGVIPMGVDTSDLFRELFCKFYSTSSYSGIKALFVPRKPIRADKFFSNKKYFEGDVEKISEHDGFLTLHLKSAKTIKCNKAVLAGGVRGTHSILYKSKLITEFSTIDDHICGYVGSVCKEEVKSLLGVNKLISRSVDGYRSLCLEDRKAGVLYTFRPAYFEMKGDVNQVRGGPVYANSSKLSMIWHIIKERKIGRLLEGVALKTGFFFDAQHYSVHFQAVENSVHAFKQSSWSIKDDFDGLLDRIVSSTNALGLTRSPLFYGQKLYFGNHLFNLDFCQSTNKVWDRLLLVDASSTQNIGGTHHSFRQLVEAYRKVLEYEPI
jgi:hypothetical protein